MIVFYPLMAQKPMLLCPSEQEKETLHSARQTLYSLNFYLPSPNPNSNATHRRTHTMNLLILIPHLNRIKLFLPVG